MVCFCSPYSRPLAVSLLTATSREILPFGCGMDYMIYACIFPTRVKHAAEVTYSAGVGCEAFELEVYSDSTQRGGVSYSFSTINSVCQASSHRKDRKDTVALLVVPCNDKHVT